MIGIEFTYSDEQWDQIRTVVRDRLGLEADQLELQKTLGDSNGTQSLRGCIESAALRHVGRSLSEGMMSMASKIDLTELRARVEALRLSLILIGLKEDVPYLPTPPMIETERACGTLVRVIDAIAAERPQRTAKRTANTSKTGRDRFWNEVLEIWTHIGGTETGIAAATFLIAVSDPVFRTVSFHGRKTLSSTPQHCKSVVNWLWLRAKTRQAATS
jgi:hypothetical protein